MKLSKNKKNFGPERARTADLLLAKQALYQLSYRPLNCLRQKTLSVTDFIFLVNIKWWAKEELHL